MTKLLGHVVRASKFVMRKSWVVTGSDDMQVRVFNYNTLEKVHTFEAHTDYIRSIIVHPTHPYVLTSSGKSCTLHHVWS
jgi:coatomer subunit beta'